MDVIIIFIMDSSNNGEKIVWLAGFCSHFYLFWIPFTILFRFDLEIINKYEIQYVGINLFI